MTEPEAPWSARRRLAFRVVFSYFALLALASLLDGGDATRGPLRALNAALSQMPPAIGIATSGISPDAALSLLRLLATVLGAALVATIWTGFDRHRPHYRTLNAGLRVVLRYFLAVTMLLYGGFKLIPAQFPPLTLSQLAEPLGNFTPMGLLWGFMGRSAVYTAFAGLAESIGGVLLFWRRTTTLGALIVLGVMSNVAMMNWTYDVPVKGLSSNLVLVALLLVAPDVARLADLFVRNRPVNAADLGKPIASPWLRKTRTVLKPLVIAVAVLAPLTVSYFGFRAARQRGPLYGLYAVDLFVRNRDTIPAIATDAQRWRRVGVDVRGALSITLMNDRTTMFTSQVDTVGHRLSWWSSRDSGSRREFTYVEQSPGGLRLEGVNGRDSLLVVLRRMNPDSAFRLMRTR